MDHIQPNDILQLSIKLYEMLGESMKYSSFKLTIYRCFNCFVLVLNMMFTFASLPLVQGGMYMKSMEGGISAVHTLAKYLCFIYYKKDIESLLDELEQFWSHKKGGHKLEKDINNIHRLARSIQIFILVMTSCIVVVFCLRPVLNTNERFIFYCWVPFGSIAWEAALLLAQYYFTILIIPVVFSYDSVYLSYSVHLISQLKLLNHELKNIKFGGSVEGLRGCIRHHQLILSAFGRMKKIFYWLLLFHYFVTLITGCTQLYLIMIGNIKSIELVTTTMYMLALFIQFGYYAFPVEEIVSQLKYISTAIYMSSWFDRSNLKQRKILLYMMMRAQQQNYLSIGGIMDMNMDAFGSVVRKVFSFCAILRNILNE